MNRVAFDVFLAALGMSNTEFAELIGCSRSYLSNLLTGRDKAGDRIRHDIATAVVALLFDEDRSAIQERLEGQRRLNQQPRLFRWAPLREKAYRRLHREGVLMKNFLAELNLSYEGKRYYVDTNTVEAICDALGIHPTEVYPDYYELAAS